MTTMSSVFDPTDTSRAKPQPSRAPSRPATDDSVASAPQASPAANANGQSPAPTQPEDAPARDAIDQPEDAHTVRGVLDQSEDTHAARDALDQSEDTQAARDARDQPEDTHARRNVRQQRMNPRAGASSTAAGGPMAIVDELLRDRGAVLARIQRGVGLAELVRTMLIAIAISSAIFGAAIGIYRGAEQIIYAAIKFPLVMLLTAAIAAPCLTAFNAALDRPFALHRDVALVLVALGFGSLLLVAQAPLLLLGALVGMGYHAFILATFGCAALAGLGSLFVLGRGIRAQSRRHAFSTGIALLTVLAVVGAQMAWTFRPYVVRPRTTEVPFIRQVEGNLLEAVGTSSRSARGIYDREAAPLTNAEPAAFDSDNRNSDNLGSDDLDSDNRNNHNLDSHDLDSNPLDTSQLEPQQRGTSDLDSSYSHSDSLDSPNLDGNPYAGDAIDRDTLDNDSPGEIDFDAKSDNDDSTRHSRELTGDDQRGVTP